MCKLIITAALFVGRIDTPFLADGVGRVGPVELDNYPNIFLKDVLSHEAHRHPFIELLGVMYLMKLRYGENFGKRAGSTWRLIFVLALFPWLNKYRILEKEEPDVADELELDVEAEDVLPFERTHLDQSDGAPPKRPSSLMKKFQSVRSTFKDGDDGASASFQKRPSLLSTRASMRGSLLVEELEVTRQSELQQHYTDLELKVVDLRSENEGLQAEVERLRQELGHRKTIRFQSANNTEDLHQMRQSMDRRALVQDLVDQDTSE